MGIPRQIPRTISLPSVAISLVLLVLILVAPFTRLGPLPDAGATFLATLLWGLVCAQQAFDTEDRVLLFLTSTRFAALLAMFGILALMLMMITQLLSSIFDKPSFPYNDYVLAGAFASWVFFVLRVTYLAKHGEERVLGFLCALGVFSLVCSFWAMLCIAMQTHSATTENGVIHYHAFRVGTDDAALGGYLDFTCFAAFTMMTVGYGDIRPVSQAAKVVSVCIVISGVWIITEYVRWLAGKSRADLTAAYLEQRGKSNDMS